MTDVMKEWNKKFPTLSDKTTEVIRHNGEKYEVYFDGDVKEFISKLIKRTRYFDGWVSRRDAEEFRKIIKELAGDKLI
jgi:hypothetical protein